MGDFGFWVWGLGFFLKVILGLGDFGGLGFGVWGLGFWVLGFRVWVFFEGDFGVGGFWGIGFRV